MFFQIGKYYAVGTVASGLSHDQWSQLNDHLKHCWHICHTSKEGRTKKTINPSMMELGASAPDVWIEPKHSIILEIRASELVQSNSFGTAYTLRFPRVQAIRTDKLWSDCCTLDEYELLTPVIKYFMFINNLLYFFLFLIVKQ